MKSLLISNTLNLIYEIYQIQIVFECFKAWNLHLNKQKAEPAFRKIFVKKNTHLYEASKFFKI